MSAEVLIRWSQTSGVVCVQAAIYVVRFVSIELTCAFEQGRRSVQL
jgi:hypothetical protein